MLMPGGREDLFDHQIGEVGTFLATRPTLTLSRIPFIASWSWRADRTGFRKPARQSRLTISGGIAGEAKAQIWGDAAQVPWQFNREPLTAISATRLAFQDGRLYLRDCGAWLFASRTAILPAW